MPVRMIEPDPINIGEFDNALANAFNQLVGVAETEFRKSYHNWDNQPDFSTETRKGLAWEVEYSTEDEPYVYVDEGTEPHEIKARNADFLRFQYPSTPRTFPGRLSSGSPSRGSNWATVKEVSHPGIEPRDFSGQVTEIIDQSPILSDWPIRVRSL